MLCTTDGSHLLIQNSVALGYISHICGGEHPPNSAVLGNALCGACWWHAGSMGGSLGAKAQIVSTGTIVPLSFSTKHKLRIATFVLPRGGGGGGRDSSTNSDGDNDSDSDSDSVA